MKKPITLALAAIVLLLVGVFAWNKVGLAINKGIVSNLEGRLFYEKRVDGVLTLFSSDANLEKETLLYSHKGKGRDSYGSYNDNIIDYCFYPESGKIEFIAMNQGDWCLFELAQGKGEAVLLGQVDEKLEFDFSNGERGYIQNAFGSVSAEARKGSIYLIEDGSERCIKKFYGIYDGKFTGFSPVGFSPDGRYLIYKSMGHLSPLGTIIDGMLTGHVGKSYIMDLETGKSASYKDIYRITWIDD